MIEHNFSFAGAIDKIVADCNDRLEWVPFSKVRLTKEAARVLIDAHQAAMAVAEAGSDSLVEERADGSVVLEMAVTNLDGFRSFVLGT